MLWLLLLLFFVGCAEGECPGEDLSLAPRPYTKPDNLSVCEKPYRDPNCTCPSSLFECACHKFGRCGDRPGCIEMSKVIDWWNDCGDWSDVFSEICPEGWFQCDCFNTTCKGAAGCVWEGDRCDGWINCLDGSDEVNCTSPACRFECDCHKTKNCTTGIGCIHKYYQCDGYNTCGDWSDEVNCTCPVDTFECDCYKIRNCTTGNGCIKKDWECDGIIDCEDRSDEVNCSCPPNKFQCACVGMKQCHISKKGSCIDRSLLCDGNRDCFDGSDETHYTCNCHGDYARCSCDPGNKHCPSSGRCIPFDWISDTFRDCFDGSDELCSVFNFTCQSCTMFATTCKSEQLARYLVHSTVPAECNTVFQPSCVDDINSCKSKNVICVSSNCKKIEKSCQIHFICENGNIITGSDFCDLASSCSDYSDEIMSGFGFKCSGSSRQGVCVLPQVNIYDSIAQCSDKSDLCFANGQFKCFQCLDKKLIISPKQVCDGVVDCFDMSDECLCLNQSLCNDIRGACPSNQMHCQNRSVCSVQSGKLCNSSVQCIDQINTKYCSFPDNFDRTQCLPEKIEGLGLDEIFKCARNDNKWLRTVFDISLSRGFEAKAFVNLICDGKVEDHLGLLGEVNCSNMFYCFSRDKISIRNTDVCDGKVDCDDGSDEFQELCNQNRFYCKTKQAVSIDNNTVCDGIIDCDNESDESRCRCGKKRFYCTNKQPLSVEWKLVQNGIQDCSDGSDECVNLAGDAFADVNEMVANPIYRAIFWVTALLALGGNLFVFVATAHSLWNVDRNQNVFINTSVFFLNLCCSDFLMGIYLLAVILQGTRFSGSYCLFDKEWRTSSLCSGLGALAIMSSEGSAFTMTAMTTFRLLSAYKPFVIRNLGVSRVLLVELFCWIFAVVLATFPLLKVTSAYFTTDVWFPNNIFGNDFVSIENMSLLAERISGVEPGGWNDVKQIITQTFPRNPIQGEFGYYGETSVCMPRLFATTNEFAWEYSTFLITINFLMFMYMVVAYYLIFKKSNRRKESKSNDVSSKMQKRISRLILTDFCCWIPICVMGYLSIGGIRMPADAYVLSACLLLPINSALNPLLYSKALEDQLTRAKKRLEEKMSSIWESTNRSSNLAVRYNADTVEESDRVVEIVG